MENILNFLENNYIWFLVAAVVLLLALIGFIFGSRKKGNKKEGNTLESTNNGVDANMNMASPSGMPAADVVEPQVMNEPEAINNTSETMTFNDVPAPETVSEPINNVPANEEIIETFDIGNPVVFDKPAEPLTEEPAINIEMPTMTPVVESTEEPVVAPNLNETFNVEPTPSVVTEVPSASVTPEVVNPEAIVEPIVTEPTAQENVMPEQTETTEESIIEIN